MKQSEFTVLMTLDSIEQAYTVQAILESNGVACQIINATAQSVLRFNGLMWGIRVVVLTSQAELANKILAAEFDKQEWHNETFEDFVDEFYENFEEYDEHDI